VHRSLIATALCLSVTAPRLALAQDAEQPPENRGTTRTGTLSGGYVGLDLGLFAVKKAVREKVGMGFGPGVHLRFGPVFWDHLRVGAGVGFYTPMDKRPTTEITQRCDSIENVTISCEEPSPQGSTISGGFMTLESGYHHRFRPWRTSSLVPALALGYLAPFARPKRAVDCSGCPDGVPLDVHTGGIYVAPSFHVTFGADGYFALVMRSELFLTGDFAHATTLGVEFGEP
jgi:hypothetical protein